MIDLIEYILIALACPLVLPLIELEKEKQNEDNNNDCNDLFDDRSTGLDRA